MNVVIARVSTDVSAGKQIREARLHRNIKASSLAKLLGVTAAAVSSWEKDRSRPRPVLAERLAQELGLEADKLTHVDRISELRRFRRVDDVSSIIERTIAELSASTGIEPEKIHLELRISY